MPIFSTKEGTNPLDPHGHYTAGAARRQEELRNAALKKGQPLPPAIGARSIAAHGKLVSEVVAEFNPQVKVLAKDKYWLHLRKKLHTDAEAIRKRFGAPTINGEENKVHYQPEPVVNGTRGNGKYGWMSMLNAFDDASDKIVLKSRLKTAGALIGIAAAGTAGVGVAGFGPVAGMINSKPIYGSTADTAPVNPTEANSQQAAVTFAGSVACTGTKSIVIKPADAKDDHPALAAMQRNHLSANFNYTKDMPATMETKFLADVRNLNGDQPIQEDPGIKLVAPTNCQTK